MGSDYTPTEAPKSSTVGYLSSLASSIQSSVLGDGTEPKYTGHPGATSNFGHNGAGGGGGGGFPSDPGYGNNSGGNGFNAPPGGFGNPNYSDPRNEKTWMQRASQLASSAASALPGFGKSDNNEPLQSSSNFGGHSNSMSHNSGTFNRAAFSNPGPGAAGFTYASNRGANAIHSNASAYAPTTYQQGPPPQSYGDQGGNMVPEMPANVSGFGRAGGGLDNGSYEKGMIDALCESGGLRPVPPEDKLQELLDSAPTLSVDIVGNCLLDVLNEESWQSRTKALIVIAKLVKLSDCPAYQQWWLDRADIVESLQTDPKAGVRTQAVKTFRAIDPSAPVNSPGVTPNARRTSSSRNFAVPATNNPAAGNFTGDNVSDGGTIATEEGMVPSEPLDMQSELEPVVEAEVEPVPEVIPEPPPPPPPQVMDLLELDDFSPAPAPPAVPNPVSFSMVAPNAPAPAPAAAPISMQMNTVPGMVSTAAPAPVSPLSHDGSNIDLLGGDGPSVASYVQSPAPPATAGIAAESDADSMFAGMSVGPVVEAPISAPASVASLDINAFDFLSAETSSVPASASVPVPIAQPPAEVDLFGSLTIVDHAVAPAAAPLTTVAVAAPPILTNPVSAAISTGTTGSSGKSYNDDFAGLMSLSGMSTNTNMGSAPSPAAPVFGAQGYPPQQPNPQGQQQGPNGHQPQHGHPQHPQYQQQQQGHPNQQGGAPYNAGPQVGLNLTRPLPPAGPGPYPYPYNYPPRGMAGGGGMAPNMGLMPRGPPPGVSSPSTQQPIQLRQGASVIAPGMLSHTAERKSIPDAGGMDCTFFLFSHFLFSPFFFFFCYVLFCLVLFHLIVYSINICVFVI